MINSNQMDSYDMITPHYHMLYYTAAIINTDRVHVCLSHTPPGAENERATCPLQCTLMVSSSPSDLCMFNWMIR